MNSTANVQKQMLKEQSQFIGVSTALFNYWKTCDKYNMNERIDFTRRKVHRNGRAKEIAAATATSDFSSSFIVPSEILRSKK